MSDEGLEKWRATASGWMGLVAVVFGGVTLIGLVVQYLNRGVTDSLSDLAPFVTSVAWPCVGFTCAWFLLRSGAITRELADAIGRVRKAGPVEFASPDTVLGLDVDDVSSGDGRDAGSSSAGGMDNTDVQVWVAYAFGVLAMNVGMREPTVELWEGARKGLANTVRGAVRALRIPQDVGISRDLLEALDREVATVEQAILVRGRLQSFGNMATAVLRERMESSLR